MKKIKLKKNKECMQPELKDIFESLNRYKAVNDPYGCFICSFVGFKGEECDDSKSRLTVCGPKDILLLMLDELKKEIKNEKSDFVCF